MLLGLAPVLAGVWVVFSKGIAKPIVTPTNKSVRCKSQLLPFGHRVPNKLRTDKPKKTNVSICYFPLPGEPAGCKSQCRIIGPSSAVGNQELHKELYRYSLAP